MKAATFFALAGAVMASPALERRSVDAASAELAIFAVLPSSQAALALTNTAELASELQAEFATATPSWFTELPTDVQSYLIANPSGLLPAATGASNSTGSFSNSTAASSSMSAAASSSITAAATTGSASSAAASSASLASASAASASSSVSTGGAALPTQVVAGGLAGVVGLVALLAL